MVFKDDDLERADWELLRHGAVTLFWKPDVYQKQISSLKELGYNVLDLNYENIGKFHTDVSSALKWKEQFGYAPWTGSLDALNDGLRGEPIDSSKDTAFCIRNFHKCVKDEPKWSKIFLDVLASNSRDYLLYGCRLVVLIQTDDAQFYSDSLGGQKAKWNKFEWLNSARGL